MGQQPVKEEEKEAATLALAGGLAFLAGATDVFGVARLHGLFVSFMSGNTTELGIAIGKGAYARVGLIAGLIGCFVAGAALGAAIAERTGRRHAPVVAFVVACLLTVPLLRPHWTVPALTLAMGALNATMNRVGQTSIGLTYVTGTLVKFGQGLGQWLCGARPHGSWAIQGAMWLSLLCGTVAAGLTQHWLGGSMWPLPLLAFVLAGLTAAHG